MRRLKSALFRWSGVHSGPDAHQWWEYFGSFGDDAFGDDDFGDDDFGDDD